MVEAIEEYTHFCDDPKNKFFVVYNVKDKVTYNFEVPYETVYLFDSVQLKNQIYFTGGGMPKNKTKPEQFFKTTARVIVNPEEIDSKNEKLKSMNTARANHTLVSLNDKILYAIGGCNETAELSDCEMYHISKNEWVPCASLIEHKMWPTVCVVDGRYLYSFGGSSNLKPKETKTIECLDTNDTSAKQWSKITLISGEDKLPRCFFMGGLQISSKEILLFGGLENNKGLDTTFYFDLSAKTVVQGEKLLKNDAFYRSKPGINGTQITIVGSTGGDLHLYDKTSKKWTMMAKATWNSDLGVNLKSDTY